MKSSLVLMVLGCATLASSRCLQSKLVSCDAEDILDNCVDCTPMCDCNAENCDLCQGSNKCCQSCCESERCSGGSRCESLCDCRSMSCATCTVSSGGCCNSCCKCRPRKCGAECGCNDVTCGASCKGSCCNTCCGGNNATTTTRSLPERIYEMPNITLPNITIVINQSPIYVNTTPPVVNNFQTCGNYTTVNNGSHVVYVSSNTTNPMCGNRTCCRVPVRLPCFGHQQPPYYTCPPPRYNWGCGSACLNNHFSASRSPCYNIPRWPYFQCPPQGCYGLGCAQVNTGCFRVPSWPFFRCNAGLARVEYGLPGFNVQYAGGVSGTFPIMPGDVGPPPIPSFPPSASHGFGGYDPAMGFGSDPLGPSGPYDEP